MSYPYVYSIFSSIRTSDTVFPWHGTWYRYMLFYLQLLQVHLIKYIPTEWCMSQEKCNFRKLWAVLVGWLTVGITIWYKRISVLNQIMFKIYKLASKHKLKLVSTIFYETFIFSPNDSPSKTIKNVFYFIEKGLFVPEILKFL